jgi:hypothetical protein
MNTEFTNQQTDFVFELVERGLAEYDASNDNIQRERLLGCTEALLSWIRESREIRDAKLGMWPKPEAEVVKTV